ncbi:MAG: hypothetical protein PHN75_16955 [Syntrophales bacterium]|nr:hypothetical protein [Syntrophales bacterium]
MDTKLRNMLLAFVKEWCPLPGYYRQIPYEAFEPLLAALREASAEGCTCKPVDVYKIQLCQYCNHYHAPVDGCVPCPDCKGTGDGKWTEPAICTACGGTGKVQHPASPPKDRELGPDDIYLWECKPCHGLAFSQQKCMDCGELMKPVVYRPAPAQGESGQYEKWYEELLAVIYDDMPEGMNERPDPRDLVKMWRDAFLRRSKGSQEYQSALSALRQARGVFMDILRTNGKVDRPTIANAVTEIDKVLGG